MLAILRDDRLQVPSPLEGEGQGGGWKQIQTYLGPRLPSPPPRGGREQTPRVERPRASQAP